MSTACSSLTVDEFLARPVVTGADVLTSAEKYGVDFAARLLSYGESVVEYYKRCSSMQSAAVRSASSASSSGARSPSQGAGLTGTRLDSIRRVESWRDSEVVGLTKKKCIPDGMCYSKLLRRSAVEDVVMRTQEWPTFGALVRLRRSVFSDFPALERFRLVDSGVGSYHVRAGGTDGCSFLDAVSTYARTISPPSGTLARAALDELGPRKGVSVSGSSRVGGFGLHRGVSEPVVMDVVDTKTKLGFGKPFSGVSGTECVALNTDSPIQISYFAQFPPRTVERTLFSPGDKVWIKAVSGGVVLCNEERVVDSDGYVSFFRKGGSEVCKFYFQCGELPYSFPSKYFVAISRFSSVPNLV